MRQTMNLGDWLRLAGLSGVWGGSFLFYRMLATELPPLTTVLGRVAVAAVVLLALLRAGGTAIYIPRSQWWRFLGMAALNNALPFTLFAWGESRVASGTAAILNAMTPMFAVLIGGVLLRTERLTAARVAGVSCGIAGVAVLMGPSALLGQDLLGQAACLTAALSYGFSMHYAKRITGVSPPNMALGQLTAATVLILPVALAVDHPWSLPSPSLTGWIALLGLAVPCTSLAYLMFFDLLRRVGGTNLSLVTLLVPVSAVFLGAVVLAEPVSWNALAGMALIAAGLAAIDGRVLRLLAGWRAGPA